MISDKQHDSPAASCSSAFDPRAQQDPLSALDDAAAGTGHSSPDRIQAWAECAQRLADERLGMVSSLFAALGCRHPATAAHSLRVAIRCSKWAGSIGMPDKLRVQLEAAALLHDIGKIAVPDKVLTKPRRLTTSELRQIDKSREAARRILTAAQAPEVITEGVAMTLAWYDGTHRSIKSKGEDTPFLSRMIAIADAYDSMTTDQVYRSALTDERAVNVLFEHAGTQFDPGLVKSFVEHLNAPESDEHEGRWVTWLRTPELTEPWTPSPGIEQEGEGPHQEGLSHEASMTLVKSLNDAVICVDEQRRITYWNPSAEQLTGVGSEAALGAAFSPGMLTLCRDNGELLDDSECPTKTAIDTGVPSIERLNAAGAGGRPMSVDLHAIPLRVGAELTGAALVLHDSSSEASLERRCRSLHAENTRDPLTQVANRAEFDRMLETFVEVHHEIGLPFSLIMTDIDFFKKINDTFGHQAGDRAIVGFASLLKSLCRSGDLVARYGGEEFAILCADCNTSIATRRAEQIRKQLAAMTHKDLAGGGFTASFGVTELQVGDTADTILRRADRALLKAKDNGRNRVVQLGNGMVGEAENTRGGWLGWCKSWFGGKGTKSELVSGKFVTNVPIEIAVEKLKGFIADREAQILKAQNNELVLEVLESAPNKSGRAGERPTAFKIEIKLAQQHVEKENNSGFASGSYVHTYLDIAIKAKPLSKHSRAKAVESAKRILGNLQSYVMARDAEAPASVYVPATAGDAEALEAMAQQVG